MNFKIKLTVLLFMAVTSCTSDSGGETSGEPAKIAAAEFTAKNHSDCVAIAPFYWEIGDTSRVIASGSTGDGSVLRSTTFGIASASKWLFGAYVLEKVGSSLSSNDTKFLTMSAGYTSFGIATCLASSTVLDCQTTGSNATYTNANNNKFFYNGGHFQKWGVDNNLGPLTKATLANEFRSVLGSDIPITFGSTQLAGGVVSSAASYALFLRKVLSGQLTMYRHLGANPVCTLSSTCPTAVSSPIPEAFHYSYGHWVEDDPVLGDGAFSGAGLFGFYPWIDSAKTMYGIVSRYAVPAGGGNEIGSGYASMLCGRQIRKAFKTGISP